jgi:uncharacterized membrane protein YphA (DoxX/SURF4 family)
MVQSDLVFMDTAAVTRSCRCTFVCVFIAPLQLMTQWVFPIKLDRYFNSRCVGLEFYKPFALLAIFLVILEVVLGVMLLLGFHHWGLPYGRCC